MNRDQINRLLVLVSNLSGPEAGGQVLQVMRDFLRTEGIPFSELTLEDVLASFPQCLPDNLKVFQKTDAVVVGANESLKQQPSNTIH